MSRGLRPTRRDDRARAAEQDVRFAEEQARARAELAQWAATQQGLKISYSEFSWGQALLSGNLDGVQFNADTYGLSGFVYAEADDRSRPIGIAHWDIADQLPVRAGRVVEVVRDYLRQQTCAHPVTDRFCEAPQVPCRIFLSWKDANHAEEDRSEGQGALCASRA
jgi:hypothetical protein